MARTISMLALLAFALMSVSWARPERSLSGVVATGGATSGSTATSGSCLTTATSKSYSVNEFVCRSAYKEAFDYSFKTFCTPAADGTYGAIPDSVIAEASAKATATVWGAATAKSTILVKGTIGAGCVVPQSYAAAFAYAQSVSLVTVVANAFSAAYAEVVGYLGAGTVEVYDESITSAYTTACNTASNSIYALLTCGIDDATALGPKYRLPNGTYGQKVLKNSGFTCYYSDSVSTTAFAEATATAISHAVASVTNSVTTCGPDCAKAFCDSFCASNTC
jgi:hypothetical protein